MLSLFVLDMCFKDVPPKTKLPFTFFYTFDCMCGIAGIYSQSEIQEGLIQSMTATLAHRGPNANCTLKVTPNLHLGHRRLSIIDLTEAANQPMTSHCGNFLLVFNGEIYNYSELKSELTQHYAAQFATHSDTEVIIEAFRVWGEKCVEHFNGMFAFALYDRKNDALFIARDRMGIKPLFYFVDNGYFAFGSELKSLLPITQLTGKFTLNQKAIHHYFRLGYIPAPDTIYKEIHKFPPGHFGTYKDHQLTLTPFWRLDSAITEPVVSDKKQAKNQLHDLLTKSIDLRLRSDVPFGTFLSGGIDSSLVSSLAQNRSKQTLNTFSIGFNSAKHDERKYAEQVAQHIGSNHHSFVVDYSEAMDLVEKLPAMFDEPFADSSAIPTYLVSQLAAKKVTMVLSGDGGDEQFLGYGMYQWAQRLNNPIAKTFKKAIYASLKASGINRNKRAAELFNYKKGDDLKSHIFSVEQYLFSQSELLDISTISVPCHAFHINKLPRQLTYPEEQALFDLSHYLPDDLLTKVDRASMQNSIEVRVPLLDHHIVEFSLNLHPSLKTQQGTSKYLLKEVLYEYAPKHLFDRPKWGFSIPLDQWLGKELSHLIDRHVLNGEYKELGLFDASKIEHLVQRFQQGETYLYNKIWLFIQFNSWYQNHKQHLA